MGIKAELNDEAWMRFAYRLAQRAEASGEVPVGAVIVKDDVCIAEGWNVPISSQDASAHAEIVAVRNAGKVLNNYRLVGTTLYVTLEPCVMCVGALIHARVQRLVFGAYDPGRGAVSSVLNLAEAAFMNHQIEWLGGVMEAECAGLLKDFFKARR